jgi:heavy metal sensor kinase
MKPLPIRWKFALWGAALVGMVLVAFAGVTLLNLYREELHSVDLALETEARHIETLTQPDILEKTLEELVQFQPWFAVAEFDADGRIARRSSGLPEPLARAALARDGVHTARATAGQAWRIKTFRRGAFTYVLAHALDEVNDITRDLLISYVLSLPVALLVAAVGGWWVAGRALRPLRELTTAAEGVRAERLDWRVPASAANDEIRRLADVLNAMLARLEKSFQQSQRFAADASHELRTPLTIMHGEIEQLLRAPQLDPSHEGTLLSLQEEIGRLNRITEHLLLLARFDGGNAGIRREPVDFSALISGACEDAELLASAHDVELSAEVAPNIMVTGDAAHLRRVALALLDNATRYNYAGGKVRCTLDARDGSAELRVGNTGPGIPEASRGQLFQRFFRVDPARARGGHGLGLSLSREIARAHGGSLELDRSAPDDWTEFVVTLPRVAMSETAAGVGGSDVARL